MILSVRDPFIWHYILTHFDSIATCRHLLAWRSPTSPSKTLEGPTHRRSVWHSIAAWSAHARMWSCRTLTFNTRACSRAGKLLRHQHVWTSKLNTSEPKFLLLAPLELNCGVLVAWAKWLWQQISLEKPYIAWVVESLLYVVYWEPL